MGKTESKLQAYELEHVDAFNASSVLGSTSSFVFGSAQLTSFDVVETTENTSISGSPEKAGIGFLIDKTCAREPLQ